MEYLMTYGWAILIVIIVVAALYAMGVFNTASTNACGPCFGYFAFQGYSDGTIVMKNGPRAINITGITGATVPATTEYAAGKEIRLTGVSTTGDVDITINYNDTSVDLAYTDTATIHN